MHNQVRVDASDAAGRGHLARYMLRAPLALEKLTYDAPTGTVIYRSRMHAGLKRNFQLMPGAEWLELLLRHIPDRYEHLVRYVGWYSNRVRGERAKRAAPEHASEALATPTEPTSEVAARAKATWARLIRKVYEAEALAPASPRSPRDAQFRGPDIGPQLYFGKKAILQWRSPRVWIRRRSRFLLIGRPSGGSKGTHRP